MMDYKIVDNDEAMLTESRRMTVEEYFDEVWKRVMEKKELHLPHRR